MGSVGTNIRAAGWGTEGLAGSSKDLGFTLVTMDSFIPSPLCVCVCVCARARARARRSPTTGRLGSVPRLHTALLL